MGEDSLFIFGVFDEIYNTLEDIDIERESGWEEK